MSSEYVGIVYDDRMRRGESSFHKRFAEDETFNLIFEVPIKP